LQGAALDRGAVDRKGREIICPALLAAFDFPAGHKPWSAQVPGAATGSLGHPQCRQPAP